MSFGWQLILGGGGLGLAALFVWLAFRYVKRLGRAEAEKEMSEAAREVESKMGEAMGEVVTDKEFRDRIKTGKFGGQDED